MDRARIALADREDLAVDIAAATGNIERLEDRALDLPIVTRGPAWELQVNRHPVDLELTFHEDRRGILQTIGKTTEYAAYSAGWGLKVARLAVPGEHSLHLQYRVWRQPMEFVYPTPGPSVHDVEMPLWVDTLGFLGWNFEIVRPDTRMRVCHLSGGGPFEHLSAEDGPVATVTPKLWHLMRRTYPGVQSIPGVLYYRHDPDRWLFICARRSRLAYTADFTPDGPRFHVGYHAFLPPLGELPVPEISLFWGRDPDAMEDLWAAQFDQYEEPPDWQWHTTWTSLRSAGADPIPYSQVADVAEASIEAGGANGFWLYSHDIKQYDTDTSPSSMAPCPNSGTFREFRNMVRRIHDAGGKVQVWVSACGLKPGGDMREEWTVKGVDERHWVSWGWDAHEFIAACSPLDPGYRQYMLDWTRRYVEDFDVDGFFLDCGVFTHPPDFDPLHTEDHFPSETGPAFRELFAEMWDIVEAVKPGQFHFWYEGVHSDYPGTGYCHGNMVFPPPPPGVTTGQRMLYNLAARGPKRLAWDTLQAYDLACGMAHWNPAMGAARTVDGIRAQAADPMNRFVVDLVRQRGTRDARGITDGLSHLDDLLLTVPRYEGRVILPDCPWTAVEHVLTGERIPVVEDDGQPGLTLAGAAAYRIVT